VAEYDEKINWAEFYSEFIKEPSISGDELKGLCPLHNDTDPSFTASVQTGQWKCYGCDKKGNAQTFLQEYMQITNAEALKILNERAGIKNKPRKYTLEDYAKAKKLPVEFLKELKIQNSKTGISIPYLDESGNAISNRQRYGDSGSGPRFTWTRGSKVSLYGLWRLPKVREAGYVVIVEGESDCHTLWYHGFHALGVPGASVFQPGWVEYMRGLNIYIFREEDAGGETFVRKICEALHQANPPWEKGDVKVLTLISAKDPSELHCKSPDDFKEHWEKALSIAEEIDYQQVAGKPEDVISDAPVQLRQVSNWRFTKDGIYVIDEKTGHPVCVCRTPILIVRRLTSAETGQEKIEVAFRRDGKWQSIITQRTTVFQAKSIPILAEYGVTATSENARMLVKFLSSLEAENIDILQRATCVSQLGWHGKQFIPGHNEDLVIDVDDSTRQWLEGYHEAGTLEDWITTVAPFRKNPIFRFILAASFAAPLLRIIGHRIFIVHNWGKTRSGKTAALKAALSAWGEPDSLMASFFTTKVGIERLAGFFRDLPLGVDERQVNTHTDFSDNLMYMLALGTGKIRGAKQGGLQATQSWRTIVLTTGEEPLTHQGSYSGVHSRVLEVYGAPFDNEIEAQKAHALGSYGAAGPAFIKEIIKMKGDELRDQHKWFLQFLTEHLNSNKEEYLQTHISALSVICIADTLIEQLLFNPEASKDEARGASLDMAMEIAEKLIRASEADAGERAWEFLQDWIKSNPKQFTDDAREPRFGFYESFKYYIFPTIMKDALEKQGFNYRSTLQNFTEKGYLKLPDKEGRYAKVKRIGDVVSRFYELEIPENGDEYHEEDDPLNDKYWNK